MIDRQQRPLINRPRYVSKSPNAVNAKPSNKPVNKQNLNKRQVMRGKRKVIDKQMHKQMQQPVSGSMKKVDEVTELKPQVKPPVEPKPPRKRKTKKPPTPPRKPKAPKEEKKDDGLFKQMKDKFIGKPKDKDSD